MYDVDGDKNKNGCLRIDQKNQAKKVAQALYDTLVNTDGSLIEMHIRLRSVQCSIHNA